MWKQRSFDEQTLCQIRAFVSGQMPIHDFMALCRQNEEIYAWLQWVIDGIAKRRIRLRRKTYTIKTAKGIQTIKMSSHVNQYIKRYARSLVCLPKSWKKHPPKVGEHLQTLCPDTTQGAAQIHGIVADIYMQIDPEFVRTSRYEDEYTFLLGVLPGYLAGGLEAEAYVGRYILPKYPDSMKKTARKQAVREAIRQVFIRDCKGYPRWLQTPEWPMGSDGTPMIYTGQKAFEEFSEYYFRDPHTDETRTVQQWW